MNKEIVLKNYIYYLLQVLELTSDLNEIKELLNFYNTLFFTNNLNFKINNKLKLFLRDYRKIKKILIKKQNKILYNKIYKILFELNKLSKMNDINEILNLSFKELNKKNMFLSLPYDLEVCVIFKKK